MRFSQFKYYIPAIILTLFIAYGSLTPGSNTEAFKIFNFDIPDKLIHGVFYFLLSLSILFPVLRKKVKVNLKLVVLLVLIFLYGVLLEIIQYYFIEGRSGEFYDVLANTAGLTAAFIAVKTYKEKTGSNTQ